MLEDLHGLAKIRTSASCTLWISAGGVKRLQLRPQDVLLQRSVRIDSSPLDRWGVHLPNPIFREPVECWPEASKTLQRFAAPVLDEEADPKAVLPWAALIWNAVVESTYGGDRSYLDEAYELTSKELGFPEGFESLMTRKLRWFRDDPRIFTRVEFQGEGAGRRLWVSAVIADGE